MSSQNTRMGTKSVALPHSLHDLDKHSKHITRYTYTFGVNDLCTWINTIVTYCGAYS